MTNFYKQFRTNFKSSTKYFKMSTKLVKLSTNLKFNKIYLFWLSSFLFLSWSTLNSNTKKGAKNGGGWKSVKHFLSSVFKWSSCNWQKIHFSIQLLEFLLCMLWKIQINPERILRKRWEKSDTVDCSQRGKSLSPKVCRRLFEGTWWWEA